MATLVRAKPCWIHRHQGTFYVHHRVRGERLRAKRARGVSASAAVNSPEVTVMKRPLEGWEPLEVLLGPFFPDELALHCLVLVRASDDEVWMCDFLPENPKSPVTATELLFGGATKGRTRMKHLRNEPNYKRWYVGPTLMPDPLLAVDEFNRAWDPALVLLRHDCQTYTSKLVEHLTGVKNVLGKC